MPFLVHALLQADKFAGAEDANLYLLHFIKRLLDFESFYRLDESFILFVLEMVFSMWQKFLKIKFTLFKLWINVFDSLEKLKFAVSDDVEFFHDISFTMDYLTSSPTFLFKIMLKLHKCNLRYFLEEGNFSEDAYAMVD